MKTFATIVVAMVIGPAAAFAQEPAQPDALIRLANEHSNVIRLFIGNEAILRGDLTVAELGAELDRVRAATSQPVSTAEPWHVWIANPELARHVDFIGVHLLPYWEGIHVDRAVDFVVQKMQLLAATFPECLVMGPEVNRAAAALPLRARGRPLGAVSFGFDSSRTFDADERGLMLDLARQSAQALERACLYEAAQQARTRAENALAAAGRTGRPVTVAGLAHTSGVSRSWLYTQPDLINGIRQLQHRHPAPERTSPQPASVASLRHRLDTALARIKQLRADNADLTRQLETAHGEIRRLRHTPTTTPAQAREP